jgi:O-antigen ligase
MAHQAEFGTRRASGTFVVCVAASAGIVALDLAMGGPLIRLIHGIALPYRDNMVLVSLIAFLCVALDSRLPLVARLACAPIMLAAAYLSESETAKVGCVLVLLVNIIARRAPRRVSVWLACVLLGVLWLGLPWIVAVASAVADLLPSIKSEGHVAERLQIWSGFLELARAGLPWGWGVETVSAAPTTSFFASTTPAVREGLSYMHPHNMAIQILVESGWPGLLAAMTLSGLVLRAIARSKPEDFASGITLFAYTCFVGLVSHGLWQAWWWASVLCARLVLGSLSVRPCDAASYAKFGTKGSAAASRRERAFGQS